MRQLPLLLSLFILASSCTVYQRVRSNKIFTKAQLVDENFYQEIPFTLLFDLPVFTVRLGQDTSLHRFIFDTGGFTVFSQELVHSLTGIQQKSYIDVNDASNQNSRVYTHMLDQLQIGGIRFRNVGFTQVSFTESPLFQCLNIAGTLGPNIMKECLWFFDMDRQVIVLTDQREKVSGLEATQRIPLFIDNIYKPWLGFTIGDQPGRATFDTGFNGSFMLTPQMQAHLPKVLPRLTQSNSTRQVGHGVVKDTLIRTRVDTLKIGPLTLPDMIVDTRASHTSNLLGAEIFRQYNVLFDLAGKAAYFSQRTPFTPRPSEWRSFGFNFDYKEGQLRVGAIYHHSAAEQAGLQSGDTILRIDGNEYSFTDYCDFLQHFDLVDQERIELMLLRNGVVLEIDLEKKILF